MFPNYRQPRQAEIQLSRSRYAQRMPERWPCSCLQARRRGHLPGRFPTVRKSDESAPGNWQEQPALRSHSDAKEDGPRDREAEMAYRLLLSAARERLAPEAMPSERRLAGRHVERRRLL